MTQTYSEAVFVEAVQKLRSEYWKLRTQTNIYDAANKEVIDIDSELVDGRQIEMLWFEGKGEDKDGENDRIQYVRLVDTPGLSGDILRLHRNLPLPEQGSFEFDGDIIRTITPRPPPSRDPDFEDICSELAVLPTVPVDPLKHFVKKGKYRSEIWNLLMCQGGACPGKPISPNIVRLLGKSKDDELVFEKLLPRYLILPRYCSIQIYRRWILQLIAAVKCLHSIGIVHRDLHIENILFSQDGNRLVVADLECRWGQRRAPEINRRDILDAGWSEKSDIFDIGSCIRCIVYANVPFTRQVEWPVPPPFDVVVEACMRQDPKQRPSLDELSHMVEQIQPMMENGSMPAI